MDPKTQDPNPGTTAHMHIPRCRETLPPMRSLDSRHWVFLREGPGGLTAQGPQGPFLPWIHRRAPRPAPKKSQRELPEEAAHFCKLEQVGARLATPPHLEEALSAEGDLNISEEFIWKQVDTDHQRKLSSDVPQAMRRSQVPLGLEKWVALNKLPEAGSFQKPN